MAFAYRRQPVKSLYILGGGFWVLLRLPFWVLRNLLPSWRPRRSWSLLRSFAVAMLDAVVAIMMETSPPATDSLEKMAKSPGFAWVEPVPDELIIGEVKRYAEINNVKPARIGGFWYESVNGETAQAAKPGEKIFYLLHGGGFVMGSASPSFSPTATIAKGLLQYASGYSRIFALEYRLAAGPPLPIANPFPACLLDVLAGYHHLVHTLHFAPENIIVVGDSAGGVLAYQLVRYCTTYSERLPLSLPLPKGLLLLSPSADAAFRPVPGTSMITNKHSDYTGAFFDTRYSVSALKGNALTEADMDRPWLSPGSSVYSDNDEDIEGVFARFPKTMILAGEAEMGRDCMRVLQGRMEREMGKDRLVYLEVDNAPHDFLTATFWEPERTIALTEIAEWVAEL